MSLRVLAKRSALNERLGQVLLHHGARDAQMLADLFQRQAIAAIQHEGRSHVRCHQRKSVVQLFEAPLSIELGDRVRFDRAMQIHDDIDRGDRLRSCS